MPISVPKTEVVSIVDYFNPRDSRHIVAYDELMKTGRWPHGFGDGLYFPTGWAHMITDKVAKAWVGHVLEVGGLRMKLHQIKLKLMGAEHLKNDPLISQAVAVMGEVEHTMLA